MCLRGLRRANSELISRREKSIALLQLLVMCAISAFSAHERLLLLLFCVRVVRCFMLCVVEHCKLGWKITIFKPAQNSLKNMCAQRESKHERHDQSRQTRINR